MGFLAMVRGVAMGFRRCDSGLVRPSRGMMLDELRMRWFGEHRSSNEGLMVTLKLDNTAY